MSEGARVPLAAVNRLDAVLDACRRAGRTALIVYVTAGHPDLDTTRRLLPALFGAGADVVELGMPFSDPLADGPTIQRASHHALGRGVRVADVLDLARQARRDGLAGPLVLLSYVNPLLARGLLADPVPLADAGFDALIVPDVPSVESEPYARRCAAVGLHWIPFLTPTSTEVQLARLAAGEGGFVYCVSVTGVTGARAQLPASTVALLQRARACSRRPVAVGFGVSGPAAARRLAAHADAVIVGSALVERIEAAAAAGEDPVGAAAAFVGELRQGLDVR